MKELDLELIDVVMGVDGAPVPGAGAGTELRSTAQVV
jgi:hypothetical protein